MFSEILKIKPQLDNSDLNKMERTLSQRFKNVAKRFGGAITSTLKGGGVASIVLGLIDKILNPLQEVKDSIDRMLKSSDDIVTNANQFGSDPGKLLKLIALAKSTGLDQEGLFTLLNKFQGAVSNANLAPNDPNNSAVKNFAGEKDMVDAFFTFMNQLRQMDKNSQRLIQEQVFGERQVLKMADFLQEDLPAKLKSMGLDKMDSKKMGGDVKKLSALNDMADNFEALRNLNDISAKSKVITAGMVKSRDVAEKVALERENARIQSYENLQHIATTVDEGMKVVELAVSTIGGLIGGLVTGINTIIRMFGELLNSRFVKGLLGK